MRDLSELVVVKLGGTTIAEQHAMLAAITRASGNYRLVLVHGGGKRLTHWLERLAIKSEFEEGRRVTNDDALEVALAVLGGLINGELVADLQRLGAPAVGITGIDGGLLATERIPQLGRVGRVTGARPSVVYALLAAELLPVVAPLSLDEKGEIVNVNADEAAGGLAAALGTRLVLLTDTDGVLDRSGQRISHLDELEAEQLMSEGVIAGGMQPKVNAALAVLRSGGLEVVIGDGSADRALERALTGDDFGTRVVLAE
jgi:acetylglutamate kinase